MVMNIVAASFSVARPAACEAITIHAEADRRGSYEKDPMTMRHRLILSP